MSDAVDIRFYQVGDEAHILRLFAQSFGRELSEERWRWRYERNPLGAGVTALAWHGGELVGHVGAHPVGLRSTGRDWRGALWGTVMTHPQFRGAGVFCALARALHARLEQLGFDLEWGFPNSTSHPGFGRHVGWADVAEVPTFRLRLTDSASWPVAPRDVVECQGFDARADRLWQAVRDQHPIWTWRDRACLQWRYVQNPSARYRILACVTQQDLAGYAVLKRYRDELHVVDLCTLREEEVELQLVAAAARAECAATLSLWLSVGHPLHAALERLGFRNAEPITYFSGRATAPELISAGVLDYRQWRLSMGDSDVY